MQVSDMRDVPAGTVIETDLAIIGTGFAGYTLASEFIGSSVRVLVLESGDLIEPEGLRPCEVFESVGEPRVMDPRRVKNRILGGTSHTWTGRCRTFDEIDYEERPWVPYSGWPISAPEMREYEERAARYMLIGPNIYDERLWHRLGHEGRIKASPELLESCFWQYSRDPDRSLDFLRLGPKFLKHNAPNIRLFYNATVTEIEVNESGRKLTGLTVARAPGSHVTVVPKIAVLAAGGIENARLLLASNRVCPNGVGNEHGLVGRFLMDHPRTSLGHYEGDKCAVVREELGLFTLKHEGRTQFYCHGFMLSPALQRREKLLNCALYLTEHRAENDPWDALKRLVKRDSQEPLEDVKAVVTHPGLFINGIYRRLALGRNVNHKLEKVTLDCLVEQVPNPDSRITLLERKDEFGVPLPRIDWKISELERRSVARLAELFAQEMKRLGFLPPEPPAWLRDGDLDSIPFSDAAHPTGTTRMSGSPAGGVVDPDCKVHGVEGLFVAGSSVFPTAGHANPTLMIVAMSVRLADRLKKELHTASPAYETHAEARRMAQAG